MIPHYPAWQRRMNQRREAALSRIVLFISVVVAAPFFLVGMH